MNSSYFALGPPTRRDESVGQSRVIDSSERRSAGWAQCKQLTQRLPCMSAPHTPHTPHTPRTDTLKSQCWHVACLHLIQLHCPCVLWLAECAVCVGLCEQLGWRLQAPRPGHLISPGWPRGLQSWGNTIKNVLSGGGAPLHCAANKTPQRLFDCILKPGSISDNTSRSKERITADFSGLNPTVICLIPANRLKVK